MQTLCCEMPWCRTLRTVALMLTVVVGMEWTAPRRWSRPVEPGAGFYAPDERGESGISHRSKRRRSLKSLSRSIRNGGSGQS